MKSNLLFVFALLLSISCKKEEKSKDGEWTLKNYSVSYFDQAGNKIFESKPEELLQFSNVLIKGDTIGLFNSLGKNFEVQNPIKTNPANLLSLSLQRSLNTVSLEFKTANEVNVKEFIVERSGSGIVFLSIATISAVSNTSVHNYSFTDSNPLFGKNYYRLKLVDFDGSSKYSTINLIIMDFPLLEINGKINLPVDLINHTFKKVEVAFADNKMVWKDEVENTVYFENGIPKSASKAKLQMEFDRY